MACSYSHIEDKKSKQFCSRRLDIGKAIDAVADGEKVIVKGCLFSEEPLAEDTEKLGQLRELLTLFSCDSDLEVI